MRDHSMEPADQPAQGARRLGAWLAGIALAMGLAGCAGLGGPQAAQTDTTPDSAFAAEQDDGLNSLWRFLAPPEPGPERVDSIPTRPEDTRPLIAALTEAALEPTSGGAILRVRGQAATTGWYQIDLVAEDPPTATAAAPANGRLTFRLVGLPPPQPSEAGGAQPDTLPSREVLAAVFIPAATLQGLREVIVRAADGQRRVSAGRIGSASAP